MPTRYNKLQVKHKLLTDLPITVVMADWDNTIMASADFLHSVYVETAVRLAEKKIYLKTSIPSIATKTRSDILKALFGEENFDDIALQVFKQVYDEIFKPKDLNMLLGAKDMLERLNAAKIPTAIISNYSVEGITEHLDIRKIDHDKIIIIGEKTAAKTKPDVAPGVLALEKLKINPEEQIINVLMIGDSITSDMEFAENMNHHLRGLNKDSSCTGILFNSLLNGEAIFNSIEIENFIKTPADRNEAKLLNAYRTVVCGYGGVFRTIKNNINPYNTVTPEMLIEQKSKLRRTPS